MAKWRGNGTGTAERSTRTLQDAGKVEKMDGVATLETHEARETKRMEDNDFIEAHIAH